MKRLLAALAVLLVVASVAGAVTVPIRSGEHAGFSRLVFTLPPGVQWRLEQSSGSATVYLDSPSVRFDVSSVFERIPRTRIADVAQARAGSPLFLTLACKCEVTAFVQSGRHLVIDVATSTTVRIQEVNNRRPYRFKQFAPLRVRGMAASAGLGPPKSSISRAATPESVDPVESTSVDTTADGGPSLLNNLPDPETAEALNLSHRRLLENIAHAAEQGLLTPRPPVRDMLPKPTLATAPTPPNLDAATIMDAGQSQMSVRKPGSSRNDACLPPSVVAVPEWGGDLDFRYGLGKLNARLFSDLGALYPDVGLELAKFYVFHGLGQEAISVLNHLDPSDPEVALTSAIATLIDSQPRRPQSFFADQTGCTSDVALWWTLSQPQGGRSPGPEVANASLRAFSKLPVNLRRQLGPRLSKRILGFGDPAKANEVLRAIDKRAAQPGGAELVAKAEIDLRRGREGEARQKFERSIRSGAEDGPEALVRLIETSFENNMLAQDAKSGLARAYASELRGSELGRRMKRASILALLLEDRFETALQEIGALSGEAADKDAQMLHAQAMAHMAARADDLTFLNLSFQELEAGHASTEAFAGNKVAERLLELGFPEAAKKFLASPASARQSRARKLLRAKIALLDRLPNRVLLELAGVDTPDAENLRAAALAMSDHFTEAAQTFKDAGNQSDMARSFWLDGSWDRISSDGSDRFAMAASLTGQMLSDSRRPGGPLGTARELLEASEATRSDAFRLLNIMSDGTAEVVQAEGTAVRGNKN